MSRGQEKLKETSKRRPGKGIKQKWFPKAIEECNRIRCERSIVLKVAGFTIASMESVDIEHFCHRH